MAGAADARRNLVALAIAADILCCHERLARLPAGPRGWLALPHLRLVLRLLHVNRPAPRAGYPWVGRRRAPKDVAWFRRSPACRTALVTSGMPPPVQCCAAALVRPHGRGATLRGTLLRPRMQLLQEQRVMLAEFCLAALRSLLLLAQALQVGPQALLLLRAHALRPEVDGLDPAREVQGVAGVRGVPGQRADVHHHQHLR
mmetsp:Transcript_54916/g.163499  ORF Transcript_54916/g.163499 Transcript_54916/m.163499 type:complete len:201 (-) Transcript_54916:1092-1694(-)